MWCCVVLCGAVLCSVASTINDNAAIPKGVVPRQSVGVRQGV